MMWVCPPRHMVKFTGVLISERSGCMDDHTFGWLAGQDDARNERLYTHDYTATVDYRDGYREGWTDVRPVPWEEFPREVDGVLVWACCVSSIGPPCQHVTQEGDER